MQKEYRFRPSPIRVIRVIRGRSAAFEMRWVNLWVNFDHLLDGPPAYFFGLPAPPIPVSSMSKTRVELGGMGPCPPSP